MFVISYIFYYVLPTQFERLHEEDLEGIREGFAIEISDIKTTLDSLKAEIQKQGNGFNSWLKMVSRSYPILYS